MKPSLALLSALLLMPYAAASGAEDQRQHAILGATPSWLVFVPEMMHVEGLKAGPRPRGDAIAAEIEQARMDLKNKLPEIEKHVTPQVVRSLSRWAVPQMKDYNQVGSLAKIAWEPVSSDDPQSHLLLEGTVDTLPTHHRLVTRWLKVYLVFDRKARKIEKVIVTIRGERLE